MATSLSQIGESMGFLRVFYGYLVGTVAAFRW
jgi:hypothetical protein